MSDPASPDRRHRSLLQWWRDMPRWKKAAVAVAVTTAVVGGVWTLLGNEAPVAAKSPSGAPGTANSFIEIGPDRRPGGSSPATTEEPASKGVFRLGFSFLVGFCVGAFVRATLRVAAIAFGFWLLATFVLSYYGIVQVDWTAFDSLWNRFAANVESEWGNFQRFMTGSLPAAGLVVTGLAVGLKRH